MSNADKNEKTWYDNLNPNQEGLIGFMVYMVLYGLWSLLIATIQAPKKIIQKLKG